uniref:Uncharacterized protein n=1 Tax=Molossus molossus TaxID=27622 RepID=A0A7J8BKB6_MOLMO|nr:hypothetical protein HJG59_010169 [Molossus molossus]
MQGYRSPLFPLITCPPLGNGKKAPRGRFQSVMPQPPSPKNDPSPASWCVNLERACFTHKVCSGPTPPQFLYFQSQVKPSSSHCHPDSCSCAPGGQDTVSHAFLQPRCSAQDWGCRLTTCFLE